MTTEESRAIAETAKFGQEVVKATAGGAGYIAGIINRIPHDLIGLIGGDWLHEKRARNLATLQEKTTEHLLKIRSERITEPAPSVILPLLEAAVDCRDELQGLWAALLANASIDGGKKVRVRYYDIVRKLDPIDAIVLELYAVPRAERHVENPAHTEQRNWLFNAAKTKGINETEFYISVQSLDELGCIVKEHGVLSHIGEGLISACQVV